MDLNIEDVIHKSCKKFDIFASSMAGEKRSEGWKYCLKYTIINYI